MEIQQLDHSHGQDPWPELKNESVKPKLELRRGTDVRRTVTLRQS